MYYIITREDNSLDVVDIIFATFLQAASWGIHNISHDNWYVVEIPSNACKY